jgi:transforming growth factor-beta-induced protein
MTHTKTSQRKKVVAATAATIIGLTMSVSPAYADNDTIYEIASNNLTTLPAALDAASLDGLFDDENAGPYTVFAPIDSAFAALDPATLSNLLLPENVGALTDILTYHVVEGEVFSGDLSDGMIVPTLNGATVEISIDGSTVMVNNATVVTADIDASNGVIHLIDTVLIPPAETPEESEPTIAAIAAGDPNFSSLVSALSSQGLVDTFAGEGSFTVFAPTNDAFAKLPNYVQRALERNPELLKNILLYHVVEGEVLSTDLKRFQRVPTLSGDSLVVRSIHGSVRADRAKVTAADIQASNGVIHVIDEVLIPSSFIRSEIARIQMELKELLKARSMNR